MSYNGPQGKEKRFRGPSWRIAPKPLRNQGGKSLIEQSIPAEQEVRNPDAEGVACLRHEGKNCPRCEGSGFRPRKRCAECGEHRSLMRNPADGEMCCLSCN